MTQNSSLGLSANLTGILSLVAAQVLLVASDTFIKLASASIPATQIMAYRGPIAIVVMVGIIIFTGARSQIVRFSNPRVVMRAVLESIIALMFIIALGGLNLGSITAILQSTPLIVTVLSIFILGQKVGALEWVVVVTGFIGVLLIVQPGASTTTGFAVLALAVSVLIAVRDILTRSLDATIPSSVVALTTTIAVCLLGWMAAPFQDWKPMSPLLWAYVFGTAILVAGASLLMVRAFRGVDLAVVSPFRYAVVLWAMALGYIVWGDIPNLVAIFGVVLVVGSGLALMRREWSRARRPELLADPNI